MLKKIIIFILALSFIFLFQSGIAFATLSCSVSTTCASPGVVVLRMAGAANSHAELPSQSAYTQLICCSGITSLSNSCSGVFAVALRLSGTTNAHVEENTQSTAVYNGNNACLSAPTGGAVSIGYQTGGCSGFDTTLASISQTPTNAHIGDASAYTRKVCATATGASTSASVSVSGGSGSNAVSEIVKKAILRDADFNSDGKVNLSDLSILLYYYANQDNNAYGAFDFNKDGKLDIIDISIMFYYWDLLS